MRSLGTEKTVLVCRFSCGTVLRNNSFKVLLLKRGNICFSKNELRNFSSFHPGSPQSLNRMASHIMDYFTTVLFFMLVRLLGMSPLFSFYDDNPHVLLDQLMAVELALGGCNSIKWMKPFHSRLGWTERLL